MYFMHYSCVVIILFSTNSYKSAFHTDTFKKIIFRPSVLFISCLHLKCHRHTGKAELWTHGLDAWTLEAWTPKTWTLAPQRLDSGPLDPENPIHF